MVQAAKIFIFVYLQVILIIITDLLIWPLGQSTLNEGSCFEIDFT